MDNLPDRSLEPTEQQRKAMEVMGLAALHVSPSPLLAFFQEAAEQQQAIDHLATRYPFPREDIARWFAAYHATQPASWRDCYAFALRSPMWLPEAAQEELRQRMADALVSTWEPWQAFLVEGVQQISRAFVDGWAAGLRFQHMMRQMFPTPRGQGARRESRRALKRKGKRGRR